MKKRNLYLKTISVEEALEKYKKVLETVIEVKWERIPVTESLNRVTRSAVYAKYCSPLFNSAAMDGIEMCIRDSHSGGDHGSEADILSDSHVPSSEYTKLCIEIQFG